MPVQATYRFGYAGERKTWVQFDQEHEWYMINPEARKRYKAMMIDCPYDLGFGNGFRTSEQQQNTHDNSAGTDPGNSYHEACDLDGHSLAVDFLQYSFDKLAIDWAVKNGYKYGTYNLAGIGDALHHQPIEVPHSRRTYKPAVHVLTNWKLPNANGSIATYHSPWPDPILKLGSKGDAVMKLQKELTNWNKNPGTIDGIFGPKTEAAIKAAQQEAKTTVDGIYGPVTRAAFESYGISKGWGVY